LRGAPARWQSGVLELATKNVVAGEEVEVLVQPEDPQGALVGPQRDARVTFLEPMERVACHPHSLGEEDARQSSAKARCPQAFSERLELSAGLRKRLPHGAPHVR
jgi:hypothetical protein